MPRFTPIATFLLFSAFAAESIRLAHADRAAVGPAEAVRKSPYDAGLRIRFGLALEEQGDLSGAERELRTAAKLSRKHEPRWTLAGFYYRQNRNDEFWFWARESAGFPLRDPAPVYDLAWQIETSGRAIRERLGLDPRRTPGAWRAWVLHAASRGHADELESVLDTVAGIDPEPLARALMGAGRIRALTKLAGHREFDWREIRQDGAAFVAEPGGGFQLRLDGRQPETCELAERVLPKERARATWPMEGHVPGLGWRTEPVGDEGVRAVLRYARPAGELRAAGTVRVGE